MVNETNALVPYRQALWVPLALDPGHVLGGLVLAREQPWSDGERHIVNELADSLAHAWAGFLGGRRRSLFARLWGGRKYIKLAIAAAAIGIMFLPISHCSAVSCSVIGNASFVLAQAFFKSLSASWTCTQGVFSAMILS